MSVVDLDKAGTNLYLYADTRKAAAAPLNIVLVLCALLHPPYLSHFLSANYVPNIGLAVPVC